MNADIGWRGSRVHDVERPRIRGLRGHPGDFYWMQTAATAMVTTADTAVAGTEPVTDQPLA
jgi:hypothetical protein